MRSLTIRGSTEYPFDGSNPSGAATPHADMKLPPRGLPPEQLYPRGLNGGFMIWLEVIDDRVKRTKTLAVLLEMRPPDEIHDFWYSCKPELNSFEAAALLKLALTSFYRISRFFHSRRDSDNRLFFVTQQLYEHDVPRLEELAQRLEARTGFRPGKHSRACHDHAHNGACQPRQKTSAGWTTTPRRQQQSTRCAPDAPPAVPPAQPQAEPRRQTYTEAAINATTSVPTVREILSEEERTAIDAERAAGHFVSSDDEVQ